MKSVRISWTLPTTRQQGGPLPVAQISLVEIELSADGGQNYSPVGQFTPDVLETVVADLPFADSYVARGRARDTDGQPGEWQGTPFSVVDTSPPGPLSITVADA